jgi:hypothetical protein
MAAIESAIVAGFGPQVHTTTIEDSITRRNGTGLARVRLARTVIKRAIGAHVAQLVVETRLSTAAGTLVACCLMTPAIVDRGQVWTDADLARLTGLDVTGVRFAVRDAERAGVMTRDDARAIVFPILQSPPRAFLELMDQVWLCVEHELDVEAGQALHQALSVLDRAIGGAR